MSSRVGVDTWGSSVNLWGYEHNITLRKWQKPYMIHSVALILLTLAFAFLIKPSLLKSMEGLAAAPVLGGLIVVLLVRLLKVMGLYSTPVVWGVCLGVFLGALYHLWRGEAVLRSFKKPELLYTACLVIPLFVYTSFTAFTTNDEIYSWGLWAVQQVRGEDPTWRFTGAPYPQALPLLLSFYFQMLGNIEWQGVVKAASVMFPGALFLGLLSVETGQPKWVSAGVMVLVLGPFIPWFTVAYADALMTASLVLSVMFYFRWETHATSEDLWLCVACGVMASLTKQPALWWTLVAFPGLMLPQVTHKRLPLKILSAVFIMSTPSLLWMLTEGANFWQNSAVLQAAWQGHSPGIAAWLSLKQFILLHPERIALLAVVGYISVKDRLIRKLVYWLLLPLLGFWLFLGGYQDRLGLHVITLLLLFFFYGLENLKLKRLPELSDWSTNLVGLSALMVSLWIYSTPKVLFPEGVYPKEGMVAAVHKFFGENAKAIEEKLFHHPNEKVWVGTPFMAGIFYSRVNLVMPPVRNHSEYTPERLLQQLTKTKPNYVVSSGEFPSRFPGVVQKLVKQKPELFTEAVKSKASYGVTLYQFHGERT